MTGFEVIVHPRAEKDLKRLPQELALRILRACLALEDDPEPRGKKIKRLVGVKPATLRLRVGDYRVLYRIAAEQRRVFILRVIHRKELARGIRHIPEP